MTMPDSCQRLVVVHGSADPILSSTLVFVGLHVVHEGDDITVWAPLEWDLTWRRPTSGRCDRPVYRTWPDIPMATASYPFDQWTEDDAWLN